MAKSVGMMTYAAFPQWRRTLHLYRRDAAAIVAAIAAAIAAATAAAATAAAATWRHVTSPL